MQDYFEKPEHIEARAILRLVEIGTTTLEDARELIGIPERQERVLRVFASVGKAGIRVGRAIAFRRRVALEFEMTVRLANFEPSSSSPNSLADEASLVFRFSI
jgi:hypothetical protein